MKLGQNILQIFLQRRMRRFNEIQNVFSVWFPELCQQLQYFLELSKGLVSRYREGWWKQEEKKEIKGYLAPLVKPDKCITRLNGSTGVMGIKGDKGHKGSRGSSGPPGIKGVKGEQGSKGEKGEIVNSAVSQTNWKQCVWKNDNDRDSGKIKVQKYPENAIKNKLICRGHIWKRLSRNAAKYIN